jgi:hypothetical protein
MDYEKAASYWLEKDEAERTHGQGRAAGGGGELYRGAEHLRIGRSAAVTLSAARP